MSFDASASQVREATVQFACGCATCAGGKLQWIATLARSQDTVAAADEQNGSVAVGGSFTGQINSAGDTDIVTVQLQAGETYSISLRGTGPSALVDPYLYFLDPNGVELASDDDGGTGINSIVTFTASTSGTYQIKAAAYPDSGLTGQYTVDVRQQGTDSVPAGFKTKVSLDMGETRFGFIESDGDVDTYKVTLTAGKLYTFEVAGGADYDTSYLAVPPGELDTRLTLFDADGNEVASNDDIAFSTVPGEGDISSAVGFSATMSGTYYLRVEAYEGNSGGYALLSGEVDLASLDPIESIDWGTKLASNKVTVYFAREGETFDGVVSLGWTDYEIQQAMKAFQVWADVTNLKFTQVDKPGNATFKLVTTASADYLGYFNPPGTDNEGVGVFAVTGTGWDRLGLDGGLEQGGYGWITLIHEFGHGIGLAHPHDNGGTSPVMAGVTGPFGSYGAFDLNQGVYTTMSYNDGWQTHPDAGGGPPPGDPTAWGYQGGPGAFDIAAAQAKYGADGGRKAGDSVYVLPTVNEGGTFWTTIWDVAGVDTLRHDGSAASEIRLIAATLDYSPGGSGLISWVDGIFGGFTIANGVVIENAGGGSGVDSIFGNAAANRLAGNDGKDLISGYKGDDTLLGGKHADQLHGNDGDDRIFGGTNADVLYGGDGNDYLNGGDGDDYISGGRGDDVIYGADESDRINGGAGTDTMTGGAGADVYLYDNAAVDGSRDTIRRFSRVDGDKVDLSAIDADTNAEGNQAFTFVGSNAFSGTAGELRCFIDGAGNKVASADVDGDRVADFQIAFIAPDGPVGGADFVF